MFLCSHNFESITFGIVPLFIQLPPPALIHNHHNNKMKLISALFLVLAPLAILPATSATLTRQTDDIQQVTEGGNDKNLRGPAAGEGGRKLYYYSKGSSSSSKGKGGKSSKSSKSKGKGKGSKSGSYSW
jgi:hypothetical protein